MIVVRVEECRIPYVNSVRGVGLYVGMVYNCATTDSIAAVFMMRCDCCMKEMTLEVNTTA